ncbi:mechanosensitive ion channel domain-containing protein [Geothrix sp. SG200]|uniref:mechanosensitive ion channel domain-containing protein n=1 Tax=Geothrix sp. SG200 TaxID=2922865 RepID=UPI001FAD5CC2|nr:mechanosensitive ion channel domain-containing protein [Geothrix sp. SG200]
MKLRPFIPAAILLFLCGVAVAGWMWTRERPPVVQSEEGSAAKKKGARRAAPVREWVVDQSPLLTARLLLTLATTPEEQQLARQAERLANHEVDLAFAAALRRVAGTQMQQTPELKELTDLKAKALTTFEADKQTIDRLTKQLAAARESQKGPLEDQLDVAKAQLELDRDELEAASEDLARAGGDPQARIRRLKEAFEAGDKESAQIVAVGRPASAFPAGSLLARLSEWRVQRGKLVRLIQARQAAQAKAQALSQRRVTIEAQANKEKEDREAAKFWASNLVKGAAGGGADAGREQAKEAVSYLRHYGDVQQRLASMNRRILDQQELAEVYASWMGIADVQRNAALHTLLSRLLWVLGLVATAYLAGLAIDQLFHRAAAGDKKGSGTLRTVVKLGVQVLCTLAIGFVIFGMPGQITTVLGLAGAGLTVALKDFIVAFFGWFILMGRNGIRVGDWVEIRGVGGEVVEIGLLRTVVLETGSWSDAGHPTGRRVAFVNNFAIEGHFFNFSTSGKWMWDELRVLIPLGQDPYPVIDGVQRLVEQQTEANARLAEQEWKRATARYRVQAFSAAPGLNVVPALNGVEIRARYITRAFERHETRLRLNQAVVELMHGPRGGAPV